MANNRPVIFIGSSKEGLSIAEALLVNLDYAADVVLWSQGVFGLSAGTLESLVKKLSDFTTGANLSGGMKQARLEPRDEELLIRSGWKIGAEDFHDWLADKLAHRGRQGERASERRETDASLAKRMVREALAKARWRERLILQRSRRDTA